MPALTRVRYVHAADGVRLAVTIVPPAGRPRGAALLVHGFSQNRQAFLQGQIPSALAAAGLWVAVGELRGHGLSERPGGWTLEEHLHLDLPCLARATAELVDGPPHLVAHSMGGLLGFASLAGRAPWASVTAIAAPLELGRGSPLVGLAARAARPAARLGAGYPVPMDRFLAALARPLSVRSDRLGVRAAQRVLALANPREADPEVLRRVLGTSDPESMAVFRAFLTFALRGDRVLSGVDLEAAVRAAEIPVAWVVGGRDIFAPPPSVARLEGGRHRGPRRKVVLRAASHVDLTVGPRVAGALVDLLGFLEVP